MSFAIEQPTTGFTWGYGDIHQSFFIASITKLYTVAMIMQLREEKALTLDTRAAELLGEEMMRGLNVRDGHDHGPAITVRELLSHTSGLPDYFEQKHPDGTTVLSNMLRADQMWTFEDLAERVRAMPSPFAPSTPGRALYSDLNYDLLGRIIEVVTSSSYADAICKRVIEPLGLHDCPSHRARWIGTTRSQAYGMAAPRCIFRRRSLPLSLPPALWCRHPSIKCGSYAHSSQASYSPCTT